MISISTTRNDASLSSAWCISMTWCIQMKRRCKNYIKTKPAEFTVKPDHDSASFARLDPLTGDWILYAPDRNGRPTDYTKIHAAADNKKACPFCVGHESVTPPTLWIGKREESGSLYTATQALHTDQKATDWLVRVFNNRYPSISLNQHPERKKTKTNPKNRKDFETQIYPFGGHEVFVDTRCHSQLVIETSIDEWKLLFRAFKDRLRHWNQTNGIEYVSIFKNSGAAGGASLVHSHCQLIATSFLPSHIHQNLGRMRLAYENTGQCLICAMNETTLTSGVRTVLNGTSLIAHCPYASEFPMQLRINPRSHLSYFERSSDEILDECAELIRRLIIALQQILPDSSYNLVMSSLPPQQRENESSFHWRIDICPRITGYAGFEIATRNAINPILPEDAAAIYREHLQV